MLSSLITAITTLAKQIQANQRGIRYVVKTGGAGKKLYDQVIKPAFLEYMGKSYQKAEIEKIGKTPSEIKKIEEYQEWLLKTGKAWERKPY